MKLDKHETQTALWQKLESHLSGRLADLRTANDGDLDPIQTSRLRGRIVELKALLALSKDEPALVTEDT